MDKAAGTLERPLLEIALDAVRAHGIKVRVVEREPKLGRAQADALLRVEHGGQELLYAAEVRPTLHPATLGAALHPARTLGPPRASDHGLCHARVGR